MVRDRVPAFAGFIHNGLPDGYMVRLSNMAEKHYGNATHVEVKQDGAIEIRNEWIFLARFEKGQFVSYWPVVRERPKAKRRQG
ncbi:MAG TPA: hypothetical protein VMI32_05590 [Candidatus Solibacter sp.]|nr:hypothetical protein [Candidatus Solibacter sp.]